MRYLINRLRPKLSDSFCTIPFFDEITNKPVPIDLRALHALKQSPMAMDLYVWLTYRMSYLKEPAEIKWPLLQFQFGGNYIHTPQGCRNFKKKFLLQLKNVLTVYPSAKVREGLNGLVLSPSRTHVKRRSKVDSIIINKKSVNYHTVK